MKMFVNVARLDIGQLFTHSMRQGHPRTLDTFLVRGTLNSSTSTKEVLLILLPSKLKIDFQREIRKPVASLMHILPSAWTRVITVAIV